MDEDLELSDIAAILSMGFFNYLSDSEGIAIHYKEHAYVIHREDHEIKLSLDDSLLQADHLQLLWLHDKDDPNDQIPEDALQLPKPQLN